MRNIYPEEKTLNCKDSINIYISNKIKENGLEENIGSLQELAQKSRMLIHLGNVDNDRIYFDVLIRDTIFSVGYFFNSDKYFLTRIINNQTKKYIEFLQKGILVYFKEINLKLDDTQRIMPSGAIEKVLTPNIQKITINQFPEKLIEYSNKKEVEKKQEEPLIKEHFDNLLNLSSIYNKYEKQKGEQQSNKMPLNYTKIETQVDEENTYIFYVGNTKEYQEEEYIKITTKDNEETEINGQISKIEQIDDIKSKVYIHFLKQTDYKDIPQEGRIKPIYNDVQNKVREKVIQNIRKGKIPAKYLYKTLENFEYEPFKKIDFTKLEEKMSQEKYPLNPSQVKSVEKGIASKDLSLILGPPGTGKTTVIAWWVKYFLKENKRILISSQNNSAVDNVIERIGKDYKNIIRIGDGKKISENAKEFLYTNKIAEFKKEILEITDNNIENKKEELKQKQKEHKIYSNIQKMSNKLNQKYQETQKDRETIKTEEKNSKLLNEKIEKLNKQKEQVEVKLKKYNQNHNKLVQFIINIKNKWNYNNYENIKIDITETKKKYDKSQEIIEKISQNEEFIKSMKAIKEYEEKLSTIPKKQLELIPRKINEINKQEENINKIIETLKYWNDHIKERNDVLTSILLESTQVVGATCIGIQSRKLFADTTFDVAIVDEAGQIQIHNILVPISRAKKAILLRRP